MAGSFQNKGGIIIITIFNLAIGVYNTSVYSTWRAGGTNVAWTLVALGVCNIILSATLLLGLYKENLFLLKASYLSVTVWIAIVVCAVISSPGTYNLVITSINSVMMLFNAFSVWRLLKAIGERRSTISMCNPNPVKSPDNVYV